MLFKFPLMDTLTQPGGFLNSFLRGVKTQKSISAPLIINVIDHFLKVMAESDNFCIYF